MHVCGVSVVLPTAVGFMTMNINGHLVLVDNSYNHVLMNRNDYIAVKTQILTFAHTGLNHALHLVVTAKKMITALYPAMHVGMVKKDVLQNLVVKHFVVH